MSFLIYAGILVGLIYLAEYQFKLVTRTYNRLRKFNYELEHGWIATTLALLLLLNIFLLAIKWNSLGIFLLGLLVLTAYREYSKPSDSQEPMPISSGFKFGGFEIIVSLQALIYGYLYLFQNDVLAPYFFAALIWIVYREYSGRRKSARNQQ